MKAVGACPFGRPALEMPGSTGVGGTAPHRRQRPVVAGGQGVLALRPSDEGLGGGTWGAESTGARGAPGAASRAAGALGVTTGRVYQLSKAWRETGSLAALAQTPVVARRLPDRLPPAVVRLLESAIGDVLSADPNAGVERIVGETAARCRAEGLKPPSRVTVRRRVERVVATAGEWDRLAGRAGAPRPPAGLVVDRVTLGLPIRPEDGGEAGLPLANIAADRATGRIVAWRFDDGRAWAAQVAATLTPALGRLIASEGPPPLVEVDRDADAAWRRIDAALAFAGVRLIAAWSSRPGASRRLARVVGPRVGGFRC